MTTTRLGLSEASIRSPTWSGSRTTRQKALESDVACVDAGGVLLGGDLALPLEVRLEQKAANPGRFEHPGNLVANSRMLALA